MMDFFYSKLDILEIRHDYLLHFFWGAIIAFFLVALFDYWGVIAVFLIGLGKEIYDYRSPSGQFDIVDIIYTVIPAIMLLILKRL